MPNHSLARLVLLLGLSAGICTPTLHAHPLPCSSESLTGAYGFQLSGSFIPGGISFATTGRFVSDGHGAVTGTIVESVNGNISTGSFTATYTVADDCTGVAVFKFDRGLQSTISFTIVSSGREVLLIDTDPGTVETGSAKKQFDELDKPDN
jgi:hypothetical protein